MNSHTQISNILAAREEMLFVALDNSLGIPTILIPSASGLPIFLLLPGFTYHPQTVFTFVDGKTRQYLPIQTVEPKVNKCFV